LPQHNYKDIVGITFRTFFQLMKDTNIASQLESIQLYELKHLKPRDCI